MTLTLTVANLGATDQTIPAGILLPPKATSLFSELASDCPASGSSAAKLIAAGTSCHITVGFSPASSAASDGFASAQYTVGSRQVALTGYSQAAALNVSAAVVDFGTEYQGSPIAPRFLYLTNGSDAAVAHAAASLPANLPFTVTDGCPANLAAHSVCRIRIDYNNPAPPADDAATLTLDQGLEVTLKGSSQPPLELGGVRRARHSWSRPPPGSSAMPSW